MAAAAARLTLEADGAARAIAAIAAHAAAEPDGMMSVQALDRALLVASPGETSLLYARYPLGDDPPAGVAGVYQPPDHPPPATGDTIELAASARSLVLRSGRWKESLARVAVDPIEVEWIWPAAPVTVSATVSRDALLEALPSGEGRLTYVGADKQLLLQAGRQQRRLPVKNRPRRRNDLGTAVAFDALRRLVEAAEPDVEIELAELRPLTIVSGAVRGVVVRGVPLRWGAPPQPPPERARPAKAPAARTNTAERERRAQERRDQQRALLTEQARSSLRRSAGELEDAVEAARGLDDATLAEQIAAVRAVLDQLADRLG